MFPLEYSEFSSLLIFNLLLTSLLIALLSALVRTLFGPSVPALDNISGGVRFSIYSVLLYWLFSLILISTPAISFILAADLGIYPRGIGVLGFFALGVFSSLSVPMFLARVAGRAHYESFWGYLEMKSGLSRKRLLVFWLSVTSFVILILVSAIFHMI